MTLAAGLCVVDGAEAICGLFDIVELGPVDGVIGGADEGGVNGLIVEGGRRFSRGSVGRRLGKKENYAKDRSQDGGYNSRGH
jgi:hypothetical protein